MIRACAVSAAPIAAPRRRRHNGGMDTWRMPLHQQPVVVAAGVVEHGRQRVEHWLLPRTWTLHAYSYAAELLLDGKPYRIRPGCVGVIAPGVRQEYRFTGLSRHAYAHIELPGGAPQEPIPVMLDLGARYADFRARFEEAIDDFPTQPMACHVRVWGLLWELARAARAPEAVGGDPRLSSAVAIIERELALEVSVADLASRVGLSHNQLTRLFRARFATTVVGYIRQRRVERAVHLLTQSDLPVREVGAQVGIADPQAFNKTVRAVTGRSPSDYRYSESNPVLSPGVA